MGSVASISPGLADLFQTLSNVDSPVLSSPGVVSALEQASPTDVAEISMEATQLESVDEMFGMPNSSSSSSDSTNSLLATLDATVTETESTASAAGSSASLLDLIG